MKKQSLFIAAISIALLANWASNGPQEGIEFEGEVRTRLNPQKAEKVTKLTIGDAKKTKQIPMYEAVQPAQQEESPQQQEQVQQQKQSAQPQDNTKKNTHITPEQEQQAQPQAQTQEPIQKKQKQTHSKKNKKTTKNITNKNGDIILSSDPKNITTFLDLSEIKKIRVPNPDQKCIYQKDDNAREQEYIEVEVTSKGDNPQTTRYLTDYDLDIYYNAINNAGPVEKKALLRGIESFVITGYSFKPNGAQATCKNNNMPSVTQK